MKPMLPVVILAGGLATRLYPLTQTTPKSLVPVGDEPFIIHQLRLLAAQRVTSVVMLVGYLGEAIIDVVGNGKRFGLKVSYAFDGDKLLGTAGAIRQALPLLEDAFFVLYGDSYLPCDYAAIQAAFFAQGKPALMTVFANRGCWDKSNVWYQNNQIKAYDKAHTAPEMQHIDYGLGVFRKTAFADVPSYTVFDLAVLYQRLLAKRQLGAYEVNERFYEVGSFAGIEELAYHVRAARSSVE